MYYILGPSPHCPPVPQSSPHIIFIHKTFPNIGIKLYIQISGRIMHFKVVPPSSPCPPSRPPTFILLLIHVVTLLFGYMIKYLK